jgi:hypothetical protein
MAREILRALLGYMGEQPNIGRRDLPALRIRRKDHGMTMYILARVRSGKEFETADAINAMMHRPDPDGDLRPIGALAIVPRAVSIIPAKEGKPERIEYRPLLPRLMFLACMEQHWHMFQAKRIFGATGKPLPQIHRECVILPRSWASCQDFAARADQECEYRRGMHERGKKVSNMRPGQIIRMIAGSIGDIDLAGRMGTVVRVQRGKVLVQTDDVEFMGRAVVARLEPGQLEAAE